MGKADRMECSRFALKSDVEPCGPVIDVLAGRSLLYEIARKEMAVFGKQTQAAIHLPVHLSGGLRRDVSRIALQAGNDHGVAYVV